MQILINTKSQKTIDVLRRGRLVQLPDQISSEVDIRSDTRQTFNESSAIY